MNDDHTKEAPALAGVFPGPEFGATQNDAGPYEVVLQALQAEGYSLPRFQVWMCAGRVVWSGGRPKEKETDCGC